MAGSDSGAGHPRVRSEDYSFVSPRSTVVCIFRDWSGHISSPCVLPLAAFRPALCLVPGSILRPSGDERTCSSSRCHPHPRPRAARRAHGVCSLGLPGSSAMAPVCVIHAVCVHARLMCGICMMHSAHVCTRVPYVCTRGVMCTVCAVHASCAMGMMCVLCL